MSRREFTDRLSDHLTEPDPVWRAKRRQTQTGMFSWGGGGPAGTTCFHCVHYGRRENPRKPELEWRCNKWVAWYKGAMGCVNAPRYNIHPETPSCSAFSERPQAAVLTQQARE